VPLRRNDGLAAILIKPSNLLFIPKIKDLNPFFRVVNGKQIAKMEGDALV
jgi:hypothetical protein